MKDYNCQVTYKSQNDFINYANDKGYHIDIIEGVLNDTYIIYNTDKKLSIKGVKARDFIILYPKFLNSWQNTFHILMTDDKNRIAEFNKILTF